MATTAEVFDFVVILGIPYIIYYLHGMHKTLEAQRLYLAEISSKLNQVRPI